MDATVKKIQNFRDLQIWQLGKEIVLSIYEITKDVPEEEKFGLISQMRRAAVSIPSNIAEGFNRPSNKDYQRFLSVALGSCAELETQIEICFSLGFIDEPSKDNLIERLVTEQKMIRGLIKKL